MEVHEYSPKKYRCAIEKNIYYMQFLHTNNEIYTVKILFSYDPYIEKNRLEIGQNK